MAIILEGPDLVGKTMLGAELSQALNLPLAKWSKPVTGDYAENVAMLEEAGPESIIDRWWPSEIVYQVAMGRKPALVGMDVDMLVHLSLSAKVVFHLILFGSRDEVEDRICRIHAIAPQRIAYECHSLGLPEDYHGELAWKIWEINKLYAKLPDQFPMLTFHRSLQEVMCAYTKSQ
jgi:hypothetical protein